MAFDPTKPANNSQMSSAEMRNQFNALKTLVDAQAAQIAALQTALAGKALMPTMDPFDSALNDPPTAADVQKVVDWMNNVLSELNGTDA